MNPLLVRAVLAALPLLGLTLGAKNGLIYGAAGALISLSAVLIFLVLRIIVPKQIHRVSFFLLLLGLVITAERFFLKDTQNQTPLLLASLLVLAPHPISTRVEIWLETVKKTLLLSFCFFAVLAIHGIFSNLSGDLGMQFFKLPAGSYLLLGLALAVVRNK